jgi:outer membrane protein assembly factor BamB
VKTHAKNSLASSSCGSDGERVFTPVWDGGAVTLFAHDLNGNELWSASLGPYASQHGPGMSPIPFNGNVYLNFDQDGAAEFICFDARTGAKKWSAPRKPFRACYSSPVVRDLPGGKHEIVIASTAGVTGYDPESGKVNWEHEWKFDASALRNVGSPVLAKDVVLAISGDGNGSRSMIAVQAGSPAKLLWHKVKETPYVPCPLVKGEHVYWIRDDGFATCAEIRTGKILWSERLFNKAISASPLMVGDTIFAVAEDGKAVAFKASPDGLDKGSESSLGEAVFASPAVADGRLFIRGTTHLFCIGKK